MAIPIPNLPKELDKVRPKRTRAEENHTLDECIQSAAFCDGSWVCTPARIAWQVVRLSVTFALIITKVSKTG